MTWPQLSRVELAPGVFVPSLEQVLALAAGEVIVYVELKGRDVEEPTIAVIRESRAQCAVHSFDHATITRASQIAPQLRRGILFDAYPVDVARSMRSASALDVWPQWELIDRNARRARARSRWPCRSHGPSMAPPTRSGSLLLASMDCAEMTCVSFLLP